MNIRAAFEKVKIGLGDSLDRVEMSELVSSPVTMGLFAVLFSGKDDVPGAMALNSSIVASIMGVTQEDADERKSARVFDGVFSKAYFSHLVRQEWPAKTIAAGIVSGTIVGALAGGFARAVTGSHTIGVFAEAFTAWPVAVLVSNIPVRNEPKPSL